MNILDFIENMKGWQKWTGGSILIVLVLFSIFYFSGNSEAIELPGQVSEIKQNATNQVINESINVIEESGNEIIPVFHETGVELAKDIDDPVTKKTVEYGWTLVGICIWLIVALAIIGAVLTALGIRVKGINK